jgi:hypothetical protein
MARPAEGPEEAMRRAFRTADKSTEAGSYRAPNPSLLFTVVGGVLTYTEVETLTPNEFDRQMIDFIDSAQVIPLRLTDRHGLLGDRVSGFNDRVIEDAWSSGYVDIDDLLASSDLGLQSVLVHFLRERQSTRNYARRLGSPSMDFRAARRAGGVRSRAAGRRDRAS